MLCEWRVQPLSALGPGSLVRPSSLLRGFAVLLPIFVSSRVAMSVYPIRNLESGAFQIPVPDSRFLLCFPDFSHGMCVRVRADHSGASGMVREACATPRATSSDLLGYVVAATN